MKLKGYEILCYILPLIWLSITLLLIITDPAQLYFPYTNNPLLKYSPFFLVLYSSVLIALLPFFIKKLLGSIDFYSSDKLKRSKFDLFFLSITIPIWFLLVSYSFLVEGFNKLNIHWFILALYIASFSYSLFVFSKEKRRIHQHST